jgi:hypothetical protein
MIEQGAAQVEIALQELGIETLPYAKLPPVVMLLQALKYMLGYDQIKDGVESFPADVVAQVREAFAELFPIEEDRLVAQECSETSLGVATSKAPRALEVPGVSPPHRQDQETRWTRWRSPSCFANTY